MKLYRWLKENAPPEILNEYEYLVNYRYKNKPRWDDAPKWANWLAQDANDEWFWFEDEPSWNNEYWDIRNDANFCAAKMGVYINSLEKKPDEKE